MSAIRVAIATVVVVFSLLLFTAGPALACMTTGEMGCGGSEAAGAAATGTAGAIAAGAGGIAVMNSNKKKEDEEEDNKAQSCRERVTGLNGLSAQIAELFRVAGHDEGMRANATARLMDYRASYNRFLGECAEHTSQRPRIDPGMNFNPTDDSWSYPGDKPPVVSDTPERKDVSGACRLMYDNYKEYEGRVDALDNLTQGLREKLGDAERIQAENKAKALIQLGYEFGPQMAESGAMVLEGLGKAINVMRANRARLAGRPTSEMAHAVEQGIAEAESLARQADNALAPLTREIDDLEAALPDLQTAATTAKRSADELESTIGPLEESLNGARRKLNGLPDRPTAVKHLDEATKNLDDFEGAVRLRDAANQATELEEQLARDFKDARSSYDRASRDVHEARQPFDLRDAAERRIESLEGQVETAKLHVNEANADLRASRSPADGNTGAVARPQNPANTGAVNPPPANRTQANPLAQQARDTAEADLKRIESELASSRREFAENDALCTPARREEVMEGLERRTKAHDSLNESGNRMNDAQAASQAADNAYQPHSGKIGRKEDAGLKRSQLQGAQQNAQNVIEEVDDTIGLINEVGPKVDQMKRARVDAQGADIAVGKQAQKIGERRKERSDFQEQRRRAQEKIDEGRRELAEIEQESMENLLLEGLTTDPLWGKRIAKSILHALGKYMSSGQSWEDVIHILEEGKKNVAKLQEQLKSLDEQLDEARKKLIQVRGDLSRCLRDNSGDGKFSLAGISGPGLGIDTDSRLAAGPASE